MEDKRRKLVVLYASQTGNALDAAERIEREAERRGCTASVVSTGEFGARSLPQEEAVVFAVSSTGQGDPPDSFRAFWMFLLQRNLGKNRYQGVPLAVFGLGDSGYQNNFVAKKLDKRLSDLGATIIIERGMKELLIRGCYLSGVMSFYATAEREKERLQYFASPEGQDDLYKYNKKE